MNKQVAAIILLVATIVVFYFGARYEIANFRATFRLFIKLMVIGVPVISWLLSLVFAGFVDNELPYKQRAAELMWLFVLILYSIAFVLIGFRAIQ